MTEYDGQGDLPQEVQSITTFIERLADKYYTEQIAEFVTPRADSTRRIERQLLAEFHRHVEDSVIEYQISKVPPRGDELIFAHIYDKVDTHQNPALARWGIRSLLRRGSDTIQAVRRRMRRLLTRRQAENAEIPREASAIDTDAIRWIVTALLAVETEFRGPRRLSGTQSIRTAEIYESLGSRLIDSRLPAHAALAFKRATSLFALDEDFDAQDRCRLARARAKRLATLPAWRRVPGQISDLLCGYGFRPFRMLGWIAVQLAIFSLVLWSAGHEPLATSVHISFINYLNPTGLGELDGIGTPGRVILVVEAWTGTVFMSVFFALLVRRWFRI
ncbi:hypothetical protein [Nocardia noduli]|uniref:hypothetical protein n=1 Tax=Nocardia noduli TaxID=2815722 RepID=UPI001C23CE91|nr:hypothetical protein [Nocardia noduli]